MFIFKSILLTALQITEPSEDPQTTENTESKEVTTELIANIEYPELQQNAPIFSDTHKDFSSEPTKALPKKDEQMRKFHLLLYGQSSYASPHLGIGVRTYSPKNISPKKCSIR